MSLSELQIYITLLFLKNNFSSKGFLLFAMLKQKKHL